MPLFPSRRSPVQTKLTYIVPHEKVIRIGCLAANSEQLDEIVKLPVDVPTHSDRALHRLHIPLLHEDRPRLLAESLHLRLRQELALPQMLDLMVQIRVGRHRRWRKSPLRGPPICKRRSIRRRESR